MRAVLHRFHILYLASIATGQKTTSKLASTSRIFSWMFRTAISQPPQEAAQYMANLGFVGSCRHLRRLPARPQRTAADCPFGTCRQFSGPSARTSSTNLGDLLRPASRPRRRRPRPAGRAPVRRPAAPACACSSVIAAQGLVVLLQVVALARMAAGDQHAVGAARRGP